MLSLDGVSKSIKGREVLHETSLTFPAGQTTVVIGQSGCGKTTLLRLVLGLMTPDTGTVTFDGETVTPQNAETLRHRIGYVIQHGGLFPHLTSRQNVTLLARYLGRPRADIAARVDMLADLMQIAPDMLDRFPGTLSGGQRQRVALMRALMLDPPVLLMDEPLGALDPMIRFGLQADLSRIFSRLHKTVVLVTHDMHEAAYFAHGIVLMREGRVLQTGSLDDLLHRPAESFVTEFVRAQRADPRLAAA
ncbi:MAG: ATP-binding cassette domain-containing protein [Betaproteobacteria bacterium]|nr:ATP-binding cassette domain-containing protein [Betaproteobacteria bacterium]